MFALFDTSTLNSCFFKCRSYTIRFPQRKKQINKQKKTQKTKKFAFSSVASWVFISSVLFLKLGHFLITGLEWNGTFFPLVPSWILSSLHVGVKENTVSFASMGRDLSSNQNLLKEALEIYEAGSVGLKV